MPMQCIRHLPATTDRPTAVAIGNFDGLHAGHRAVIAAMVVAAKAQQLVPSVLTFEPHPRQFFAPHSPCFRLERVATKLARLREAGVARMYMPRFDAAFAAQTADDFLRGVLQQRLGAQVVVTGDDFAFGKNRGGDVTRLRAWGVAEQVEIITVPPVMVGDVACSSSAVRAAISAGDMAQAAVLLGRPYALTGRVVHGDGRGAGMGFATANVALSPALKLPAYGVYAVRAYVRGECYDAVANIGIRPTVSAAQMATLEVHLLDQAVNLYGEKMTVQFFQYIRGEQKFDGIEMLATQIARDCAAARTALAKAV